MTYLTDKDIVRMKSGLGPENAPEKKMFNIYSITTGQWLDYAWAYTAKEAADNFAKTTDYKSEEIKVVEA